MNRLAAFTLAAFTLAASLLAVPSAHAAPVPCSGWQYRVVRSTTAPVRVRRLTRLTRCVFTQVGIPDQIPHALYVQERESGFWPWAKNPDTAGACRRTDPYGSCGSFQHLMRYWGARVVAFLPRRGFPHWPHVSPLNARANVWVTARMVKSGGWGPWR